MARVIYIRVRSQDPEADDLGWAVIVNGRFIATDSPYETGPCCEEIAQDVAIALGCGYEERVVTVPDDWNWDDILAQLGETPRPSPVVLSVQEDGDSKLPAKVGIPELRRQLVAYEAAAKEAVESSVPYVGKFGAFLISAEAWSKLAVLAFPRVAALDELLRRRTAGEKLTEEEIKKALKGIDSRL